MDKKQEFLVTDVFVFANYFMDILFCLEVYYFLRQTMDYGYVFAVGIIFFLVP